MKKTLTLLLAMILALPVLGASADGMFVLNCPEEGFSTMASFTCFTRWEKNDGLYVYLKQANDMPYILISVDRGNARLKDDTAFSDILYPSLQNAYSQYGGTSMQILGDYTLAGRPMYAAEFQFTMSDGYKSRLFFVIDAQADCSVYYRLRCMDEADMPPMQTALGILAENLRVDGGSGAPDPTPTPIPTPTPVLTPTPQPQAADGDLLNMTVTDIVEDGMLLGRCAAPAGWRVMHECVKCTKAQSISFPWCLNIRAVSPNGSFMGYSSARDYLHVIRWDGGPTHQDGVYNSFVHTTLMHQMDAAEYCDNLAQGLAPKGRTLTLVDEETFPQARSQIAAKEQALAGSKIATPYLDMRLLSVDIDVCARRYSLELDGIPSYICVMCATEAYHMYVELPNIYRSIVKDYVVWQVPFNYVIVCEAAEWDALEPVFNQFVDNTSVSDQFTAANERLAGDLWARVNMQETLESGLAYSIEVMREETASGDSYDDDRFTDYLFDQNDYTLSDGSHVKVSTDYDYVYQLDNGNVVYTDSALYEPGGATQLYPNR